MKLERPPRAIKQVAYEGAVRALPPAPARDVRWSQEHQVGGVHPNAREKDRTPDVPARRVCLPATPENR